MKVIQTPKDLNLIDAQALAKHFDISPRTVRKYAKKGLIPNTLVTMSKNIEGKVVQYYWKESDVKNMKFHRLKFS